MAVKAKKQAEPVFAPGPAVSPSGPQFPSLNYADFATFGRDNIEAAVKTNAALSAGMEAISQEVMVYARSALQTASETARSLLGAKTLEDVVKLQTDLAKRHFEGMVAGSVKLSELGVSLASEAFAPWEGRVEAAMARFTYPQATKSHAA
jgi:phasin family protein